jgi:hypothetical protein
LTPRGDAAAWEEEKEEDRRRTPGDPGRVSCVPRPFHALLITPDARKLLLQVRDRERERERERKCERERDRGTEETERQRERGERES